MPSGSGCLALDLPCCAALEAVSALQSADGCTVTAYVTVQREADGGRHLRNTTATDYLCVGCCSGFSIILPSLPHCAMSIHELFKLFTSAMS